VAIALEIGVCDLLPELLADALVFFGSGQSAGAVTAGALESVFYSLDNFGIFIESDSHRKSPFSFYYTRPVKGATSPVLPSFLFPKSMIQ
jgi:hypothetical protein